MLCQIRRKRARCSTLTRSLILVPRELDAQANAQERRGCLREQRGRRSLKATTRIRISVKGQWEGLLKDTVRGLLKDAVRGFCNLFSRGALGTDTERVRCRLRLRLRIRFGVGLSVGFRLGLRLRLN